MPDVYPTNMCFGGPDRRTAYITLSGTGRLGMMQWPEPGLQLHCGSCWHVALALPCTLLFHWTRSLVVHGCSPWHNHAGSAQPYGPGVGP